MTTEQVDVDGAAATGCRVQLTVNGREVVEEVPSRMLLSDFLRHELGLTGTHVGCEHGVCGACTVALDGEPVRSCLIFTAQVDGCSIDTVESLEGADGELGTSQAAFAACDAFQCGFCTPGFLMLTEWIRAQDPAPAPDEIREFVASNICRCTGYAQILEAVEQVVRPSTSAESSPPSEVHR